MTEHTVSPSAEFPELECSCLLYRVMLRSKSKDPDTGEALPDLFFRRPRDQNGLSVNIVGRCTIEEITEHLSRTYGVVTLHVGRIRDLGLDVRQDSENHANITGVPFHHEDQEEAERIAGLLAKQCRPVIEST